MLFDDAVGKRESEAGAFADGLGGEEGIEDLLQVLGRNAAADVGNFDTDLIVAFAGGADGDGAAFRDGMRSVDQQVLVSTSSSPSAAS